LEELEPRVVLSPTPIGLSDSMPVMNQAVTLTVDPALTGYGEISITGSQGTLLLPIDGQGQAVWVPSRYGQYSLTVGPESEDVWVTAQPMIFHWTGGDNAVQNITIVQEDNPASVASWRWRGVTDTTWVGAGSTYHYTDPQSYVDTWDYARSYDGFSLDELYVDDTNAESLATAQAVGLVPQQWGPNYTLAVWCSGFASSTATSVSALRSANAPILMEDYWGDYSLHALRWNEIRQAGLQAQSVLDIAPGFYISEGQRGPRTAAEVRETFREVRLAAPESPGIGVVEWWDQNYALAPAVDQAITDFYLKPVIDLSVNAAHQLVAWNIGNDDAQGFSVAFLDRFGNTLQTVNLSAIQPNDQEILDIPLNADMARLVNPAGTVNLYANGTYTIPPPPGRYSWTDDNGEQLWSTFSNWDPHGPPPGNIDSGNYAYFDSGISTPISVIARAGETSINSVVFATAGWSIAGSPTAQDFFTYAISSAGAGTNTVNIGYRTTSGVPAYFYVDANNTLVMNGEVFGNGGEIKGGAGTLVLTNANTYPGPTTINAGTLAVNGAQPNSAITVGSGATLAGTGQTGPVTVYGTLSPGGAAPGILHTGNVLFAPNSTYGVRLNGTSQGSGHDATAANGPVNLGDASLMVSLGFGSLVGDRFTILTSTGTLSGTFHGLPNGQVFAIGDARFRITYTADSVVLNHVADAATQFLVSAPAGSQAGAPFDVTVTAVDPGGHVDPLYAGTIHLSSTDAGALLPADYTFTAGDQGTVTFVGGVTLFTAGDQTVTATDVDTGLLTGSTTITVTPAAADHLVFLQQPTDTAAGQTITPAVMVAVVDQFGNVVTGDNSDTVTLTIGNNPSGGTLSGTLTVAVVNGIAAFSDLSIDQAGDGYTLHATVGGSLPDLDSGPFSII
jgi:autotransporter-associated beta strand protein